MAEDDSLDIVKSIRNLSNKDKGATPIVLFVDSVSYDDYKKAKSVGVNECLHKPLNLDEAEEKLPKII